MKTQLSEPTGLFIVRLWFEANHETGMRARITKTIDAKATEQSGAVTASADGICAIVKEWVEAFENSSSSDGEDEVAPGSDQNGSRAPSSDRANGQRPN
jgi:hypothetical protein